jgi:hypothetical protein
VLSGGDPVGLENIQVITNLGSHLPDAVNESQKLNLSPLECRNPCKFTLPGWVASCTITNQVPGSHSTYALFKKIVWIAGIKGVLMRNPRLVASVSLVLAASVLFWAQSSTTSIRGTISDKSGAAIPKAKVTLHNPDRGIERKTVADATGNYEFLQLPPGTYRLSVEMAGFRKQEQPGIQLLVNSPAQVNLTLQVGTTTEMVEVTAESALVNVEDASLGNAFNERQVKELPMEGRNVPDLLSLQAGVAYTGNRPDINKDVDTRSGAVNGAHSDQSNITLDGVNVNDEVNGYAFTTVLPVTLDSVQEFRVTTTNYNADQGRSSGAQISLVTKSGTNSFHGSLYEYHRNTLTSANDFFVKQAELSSGQPNQPPKLMRNIFGGSVGGPIVKNRLFFFANYEAYRQREENSVLRIVPSDALRDGVLQYLCADPTQCLGGPVQGLTGTHTIAPRYYGLTPGQLTAMDPSANPATRGPDPAMLNYFNSFPHANDFAQGDTVNFVGYRFRGPVAINNNWYITKVDYKLNASGTHSLFWRGALRNDTNDGVPYLPGQVPEHTLANYSKGFTAAYTAVLRPTLINNFRWGYTRQSFGDIGNSSEPFVQIRALNDDETTNNSSLAFTRTRQFTTPVNNFVDDLSWTKGRHTLQFGTNIAFIRNPRVSFSSSFSDASTNASWLPAAAIAGTGGPMDPGASGFPAVDPTFTNGYDYPLVGLIGAVTEVDATWNYKRDGSVFPQGAGLTRRFATDSYEFYAQDSWKIEPNLTVTYGLRYSLFSPPWETNGLEVTPTFSLGTWFNQRGRNMLQGIGSFADPLVSFGLAGAANGKPGFYNWDYHNFGPRLSIAWSPHWDEGALGAISGGPGKTSIRAGFGIVYDRIGQGLLTTYDKRGSFGMSTTLTSQNGLVTLDTAPRVTDIHTIPTTDQAGNLLFSPAPAGVFPQTFPSGNQAGAFAATWGLDSSIKTPYSYALDFSIGRELTHDFSVEASYVGRLSHRLLVQEDLAQPLNLVDPKTGVDYYHAVKALAVLYRQGVSPSAITPALVGPTAQYWYDMTQALAAGGAYSLDAITTQGCPQFITPDALEINYALFSCYNGNETTAIQRIDQNGFPDAGSNPANAGLVYYGNCGAGASALVPNCYLNSQYASVYAWRSIGSATYHALQVNLRKRMRHGVQFDFNYTYSKSLDLESDAERVDALGAGSLGLIFNAWNPRQSRAVSDFDTPHQVNANWLVELPFGRGKVIATGAHGLSEAFLGGWELSGVARWTSGFPVSILNGFSWPTNWDFSGNATQIAPVKTGTTHTVDAQGNPIVSLFPHAAAALNSFIKTFPGDSGSRNTIRGDGFAGLDLGLSKRWKMPRAEGQSLQFRWDVFNVLNLTRFDVQSVSTSIDSGSFGNYTGLLTNPRVMQFALRYEF